MYIHIYVYIGVYIYIHISLGDLGAVGVGGRVVEAPALEPHGVDVLVVPVVAVLHQHLI